MESSQVSRQSRAEYVDCSGGDPVGFFDKTRSSRIWSKKRRRQSKGKVQEGERLLQNLGEPKAGSPCGLCCDSLFRYGLLRRLFGRNFHRCCRPFLCCRFRRLWWNERGFGLGEKVGVVFARDVLMSSKNKTECKPGQFVIRQLGDGGRQDLFRRLLVILVASGIEIGYVFSEVVRVKVDEGAKKHSQLRPGKRSGSIIKNAIEPFQTHVFETEIVEVVGDIWRPRRDSNPCYRRERAVS